MVSAGRVHTHTVAGPCALTQEFNRCLMMVRVAATRRGATPQKATARSTAAIKLRPPKPEPIHHS